MYIGIDVGATNIKLGLFDGSMELKEEVAFPTSQDYKESLKKMISSYAPEIKLSVFGEKGGMYGAAALFFVDLI